MKYPIPDSDNINWQQTMLREIDMSLERIMDDCEISKQIDDILLDVIARVASLREYSGY